VHIIPVLDIKDGLVVRARLGDRRSYKPIETPLSPTADMANVAAGLRTLYPFPKLYIADLDAIERRRERLADQLKPLLSDLDIWLDSGFNEYDDIETALATDRLWPVLGSESQQDSSVLATFHKRPHLILSLDFRDDDFLGPSSILENADRWPASVIVMTLGRIGANSGPDFERLIEIKRRAGGRMVVAAGGVRGFDDLQRLQAIGVSAALVATALHDGALTPDLIASLMKS
jgi:phosphoribosylformimino-5-aminoimidazole carboxamide ribotide isomerase